MWNIRKIVSKGDYDYAVVPQHPKATKNHYVLLHRVIVENHIGRLLNENEVVHHINGDKKDNRIQNLEVMDKRQHNRHHGQEVGRKMLKLKCPWCKKEFILEQHNSFRHNKKRKRKYNCCSSKCSWEMYRYIQLHGLTSELENAISENILAEYRRYLTDEDNSEETQSQ